MEPLGLIAGEGVFPLLVAQGAKAAGRRVVCCAFAGHAWPELRQHCDEFRWVGLARVGSWVRCLRRAGCRDAIMVGRVAKTEMYDPWRYFRYIPDLTTVRLFYRILRSDKRPQTLLQALVDRLATGGITLIDSTTYTPDHLVTVGVLTHRQPTPAQWADIRYGWEVCQTISRLDIGQSIAVRDREVIAVEALEGTNAMIDRAGKLCRGTGGWVMLKAANARQDMRVDVPTIGTTTIEKLAAAGAGCVVLEPGKTVILERSKVLELAERYKIAIVGYAGEPGGAGAKG
ncbi:MAG TPA: UDP-2,3-diacylglucosamine diphosphatase LpxI [Humisphaera sp.]